MFDDPTALRSDWHDSIALGKYLFVPSMCNNSFCRVKFPNCLKHNISIQIYFQSMNDEWWVYTIMDPHYSNNIFVCGTTHETGQKQSKFVTSENAHYSFLNLKNIQKALLYTKVKLISNLFFLNRTYPRNVLIIKCHPMDTLPMPYIQGASNI